MQIKRGEMTNDSSDNFSGPYQRFETAKKFVNDEPGVDGVPLNIAIPTIARKLNMAP